MTEKLAAQLLSEDTGAPGTTSEQTATSSTEQKFEPIVKTRAQKSREGSESGSQPGSVK